ncbi:MAG: serine/threonine-protein kinase, partial [Clostridia bacterium]|nr:serine/threonine-protein kinase [Clostridia bacterium]
MENYLPDLSNIWPEWRAVQKLGEGSFGKVYKCERNEYGINTVCAVKIISIPQNESEINAVRAECTNEDSVKAHFKEIVDDFANEIKIMVDLKGAPNIVTVENYKIVEREDSIGWDIYIRMEFLTAFTDFARKNTFTEKAVAKLAADICEALEICAGKNIIHRDIKPDNIFIDSYGNYKIGDFGVARKLENASIAMSKKGTYTYMAP